jgi:hypothetical protein
MGDFAAFLPDPTCNPGANDNFTKRLILLSGAD